MRQLLCVVCQKHLKIDIRLVRLVKSPLDGSIIVSKTFVSQSCCAWLVIKLHDILAQVREISVSQIICQKLFLSVFFFLQYASLHSLFLVNLLILLANANSKGSVVSRHSFVMI